VADSFLLERKAQKYLLNLSDIEYNDVNPWNNKNDNWLDDSLFSKLPYLSHKKSLKQK
jgi:hypothetical protein